MNPHRLLQAITAAVYMTAFFILYLDLQVWRP
jgi:hypothetical protein